MNSALFKTLLAAAAPAAAAAAAAAPAPAPAPAVARDIRNYRPITLLNADYLILTKILVSRFKRVMDSF
eukprot:3601646-Prymnesium_polylepis.1